MKRYDTETLLHNFGALLARMQVTPIERVRSLQVVLDSARHAGIDLAFGSSGIESVLLGAAEEFEAARQAVLKIDKTVRK